MHGLRLAIRALLWRKGLSATMFAIAALSMTAAAIGPLYSRAAEESLLGDRLRSGSVSEEGFAVGFVAGKATDNSAALAAVREVGGQSGLDRYYGPALLGVQAATVPVFRSPAEKRPAYVARLAWREGQCSHLRLAAGRCVQRTGEAMISAASARTLRLKLGDRILLRGLARAAPALNNPQVVGIYQVGDRRSPYWFDQNFFDAGPGQSDDPDRLDTVFVSASSMGLVDEVTVRADSQRALRPNAVRLDDLTPLRSAVAGALRTLALDARGYQLTDQIGAVLDEVQAERRVVALSVPLVTGQLVLLTWFVLFLIVAGATEERSGEVALAKLRGLPPAAATTFGLAEPLLLIAASVPVGLAAGWLASRVLAGAALLPGTPVVIRAPVLFAVGLAVVGGAVAAALAARRILTLPVLDQLRRTAGEGASTSRSIAVDAVAVTLAAAGIYQLVASGQLDQDKGNGIALLTPGLLAVAVALIGVRLLPLLARIGVRRTRRSARVAAFLSTRQITRRPVALRIVVLLTVAVALATFAVDGWWVAARNRDDRARQEVGAHEVMHVAAGTEAQLLAATRGADPSGRYAMAATELIPINAEGSSAHVLAVDSPRLAAVGAWDRNWAALTVAAIASRLRPRLPAPVIVRGASLAVRITTTSIVTAVRRLTGTFEQITHPPPPPGLHVSAVLQLADGRQRTVPLGLAPPAGRSATLTAAVACTSGCRLAVLQFEEDLGDFTPYDAEIVVTALAAPGAAVEAGLGDPNRWRAVQTDLADPTRHTATVAASARGLTVTLHGGGGDVPQISPADTPAALPVAFAADTPASPLSGTPGYSSGTGLDGQTAIVSVVATAAVLPRTGRSGELTDLQYADRVAGAGERNTDQQVWLAPGTPRAVLDGLTSRGVRVLSREWVSTRRAELDRQGPALALLLFLVAAVAALLLAVAAVATTVYIGGRRRAYELAAMRTFGVPRRTLIRAGSREQLVLLGSGVLLGASAGLAAALLALPAVPVYADRNVGPPLLFTPAWAVLGLMLLVAAVAVAVVGHLAARQLVRVSLPDRLREAQA